MSIFFLIHSLIGGSRQRSIESMDKMSAVNETEN